LYPALKRQLLWLFGSEDGIDNGVFLLPGDALNHQRQSVTVVVFGDIGEKGFKIQYDLKALLKLRRRLTSLGRNIIFGAALYIQ
jgi:hypothetical protein